MPRVVLGSSAVQGLLSVLLVMGISAQARGEAYGAAGPGQQTDPTHPPPHAVVPRTGASPGAGAPQSDVDPRSEGEATQRAAPPYPLWPATSPAGIETEATAPVAFSEGPVPWYETFEVRAFVDAYGSVNYQFPKPQADGNSAVRAFDTHNGFSLAWAGLDLTYPAQPFGGTLSLRFGPAAQRWAGVCLSERCDSDRSLENVKQAFASFKPGGEQGSVTLDAGKFDTIFGAETADSQNNINYTRGLLFWLGQPGFHAGLRANFELGREFALNALLVNGWNNTIDNNAGKSLAIQLGYKHHLPSGEETFGAALGYLVGPERDDTLFVRCDPPQTFDPKSPSGCVLRADVSMSSSGTLDRASTNLEGLRHFVDLVLSYSPMVDLRLSANADLGIERLRGQPFEDTYRTTKWYGAMLGARYQLCSKYAVAARAEYLKDEDGLIVGYPDQELDFVSGTLTLDFLPSENAMIRLDNRFDWSNYAIFQRGIRDTTGTLVTSTLGVVLTTR